MKYQNRVEERKFEPPLLQPPLQPSRQSSFEMDVNQKVAAHMERVRALREAQQQVKKSNIIPIDKVPIPIVQSYIEAEKKPPLVPSPSLQDVVPRVKVFRQMSPRNDFLPNQPENRKKVEKNERIRPPMKPAIPKQEVYPKKDIPKSKPMIKITSNNQLKVEGRVIQKSPQGENSIESKKANQAAQDRFRKYEQLKNRRESNPIVAETPNVIEKPKVVKESKIVQESKVEKREKPKPLG